MLIIFLLITFFLNYSPILASDRNIFGLHLTQPQDIASAKTVINSSQGDWGWATIVIRTDQLDHNTWQDFFDNCRKYHIIPIVRLATIMENGYWKRPALSDIDNLASFLNSLNWPTTDQHVILFNEINHASEWGGAVDVKSFADMSIYAYQKLKSLNSNFIVLSSPFDLAAPNQTDQLKSAADVYHAIYLYNPKYFDSFDALASHSYPNHGYVGTPSDTGQHSIHGYLWELNYIKSLGINKTYPVYITETGWPHREGESKANNFYTVQTSAKFLIDALKIWGDDPKVIAVTPFIYNYPHPPFDHFSWVDTSERLYPEYQVVADLPKNQNHPLQSTKYEVTSNRLPFILITNTDYSGKITLKNTGQSIWGETKFCLEPKASANVTLDAICTTDNYVYPGQSETFDYKIKINNDPNYTDKTTISWDSLTPFEIIPINDTGTIYSPKTTLREKFIQFIQSFFI